MNDTAAVQIAKLERAMEADLWSAPRASQARLGAKIREASFADYQQVAALQARNGLVAKSYSDWCALWSGNPTYLKSSHRLPIGWVLEAETSEVVGFLGNLPLSYAFRGRELLAATAHSWVVDFGYRGNSIGLLDTFLKQTLIDVFVFATVNSAAESVLRAFRLNRIPVGRWDMARFWITGYRGFARSAVAAHSVPFPRLWAPPLAGALWMRDRLCRRPLPDGVREPGSEYQIEVCTEFDKRFEQFWKTTERQHREQLLAVRDREALAWHYRSAMARDNLWVVAVSQRGRLVAYWVVDRQDHPELRLKRLRFVDFQSLAGFEHLLRSAVAWTLQMCRQEGIHVADNLGSWLERYKIPGTTGPYRRQMRAWLFYYYARRGELAEQLKNPAVWMPSSYDGDASL